MEILRFHFAHREYVPELSEMVPIVSDLTFCFEGEMHYIINGEELTLRSGDALFIPKGTKRRRLYTNMPNYYASINILHDEPLVPSICGVVRGCADYEVLYLIKLMERSIKTVSLLSHDKCVGIFSYLYSAVSEKANDIDTYEIRVIKQYIADKIRGRITLKELADVAHFTPQYLCSIFRKQTGMTPMQYVSKQRIELAKRMIITYPIPLYEIAQRCGFNDYCSFSHSFKKHEGISVSEYKRSNELS